VAAYVRQLRNSIGYVEYAYAKQNNLAWAQLQNRDGRFVAPTQQAFAASAANADWNRAPGMGVVLTDEPGADSWPVTAASFILMPKTPGKPQNALAVLEFFDWALQQGGQIAVDLDYVPLPPGVVEQVRQAWRTQIKTPDGAAVWPGSQNR